jgi:hypothetical protein
MSTIKAGDVVRFNQPKPDDKRSLNLTAGNRYVVTKVRDTSIYPLIDIVDDSAVQSTWSSSLFTKVEREFKVGDVVEVIDPAGKLLPLGLVGTITKITEDYVYLIDHTSDGWFKSRFKIHTPMPSPAPEVKWMVCPIYSDGTIKIDPNYTLSSANEEDAKAKAEAMAKYYHNETFAAVSFTIASAYRAEPVETKTVKYEVRQVR